MKQHISTKRAYLIAFIFTIVLASCAILKKQDKPTLFLIGDSTVRNGQGKGGGGLWGWGSFAHEFFNLDKINVENKALGGTSSRTFYNNSGLWDSVLVKIKPGDFVMMQFGHNDSSPLDDSARARGTIKGNGPESKVIYNPIKKQQEEVYTYGAYLRKFIADVKAKGATPIVCSLVPRNSWNNGKVNRSEYAIWAGEAAKEGGAYFIDLNKIIADEYDAKGEDFVKTTYFGPKDATHTIEMGAKFNAKAVVKGIKENKGIGLKGFLK
jgi:rhamnogalacturonan acetylesterase